MKPLVIGDRVKYRQEFLGGLGGFTGVMPFAKGRITNIEVLGAVQLATIDWGQDNERVPEKVIVKNLTWAHNHDHDE